MNILKSIIRPLVWEALDGEDYEAGEQYCSRAKTSHLGYFVTERAGRYRFRIGNKLYEDGIGYPTIVAAQAAAEADHVARFAADLTLDAVVALVEVSERFNAACDAMWNDQRRVEGHSLKELHVKSISEAQQALFTALAAFRPTPAPGNPVEQGE